MTTATAMPPARPTDGVGARIVTWRHVASLTQVELARGVGRSVQWLQAIEQGRAMCERLSDLIALAEVLGCQVADLIGRPVDSLTPGAPGGKALLEPLEAVRIAIMRTATPGVLTEGTNAASIDERVDMMWSLWHAAPNPHVQVGQYLSPLITDAAALAAADPTRAAFAALSGTYAITRQWLHHATPDPTLTNVVAIQALEAARRAEDPLLVALAAWALSASYRRLGQQEEATRLCLTAADELKVAMDQAGDQSPRMLAAYGMLHLAGSVSAAQSSDEGRAWYMHGIADAAAATLGDFQDPWTVFGRPNVEIHALAVAAELGDSERVIELSRRVDVDAAASTERRAGAMIDIARAFVSQGQDEAAVRALLGGEAVGIDRIRNSPLVHEMVKVLLNRNRASTRNEVRGLAARCGLIHTA